MQVSRKSVEPGTGRSKRRCSLTEWLPARSVVEHEVLSRWHLHPAQRSRVDRRRPRNDSVFGQQVGDERVGLVRPERTWHSERLRAMNAVVHRPRVRPVIGDRLRDLAVTPEAELRRWRTDQARVRALAFSVGPVTERAVLLVIVRPSATVPAPSGRPAPAVPQPASSVEATRMVATRSAVRPDGRRCCSMAAISCRRRRRGHRARRGIPHRARPSPGSSFARAA